LIKLEADVGKEEQEQKPEVIEVMKEEEHPITIEDYPYTNDWCYQIIQLIDPTPNDQPSSAQLLLAKVFITYGGLASPNTCTN